MFIASKYEDIYPLKLKVVFDKIAHRKIDEQSIINMEMEILQNLDFQARQPTILDFLSIFCEFAVKQSLSITQLADNFELIELLTIYLAKLLLHDYELSQLAPSLQAAATTYVAMRLTEKFKRT